MSAAQASEIAVEETHTGDALIADLLCVATEEPVPEEPVPEEQVPEEQVPEEQVPEQMDEATPEEAQTSHSEVLDTETSHSEVLDTPTDEAPLEAESNLEEQTEAPVEREPAVAFVARRRLLRRPPRWQQSTATQSSLQRALHIYKLESKIDCYALNREEIQAFAPPETRRFLIGTRPAPAMDAAALSGEGLNGDEPSSAEVNALGVPNGRLQITHFHEAIQVRGCYEKVTHQEMVSATMPTAYETWKMEKEYSDLRTGLKVYLQNVAEDNLERNHRAGLWSHVGARRTILLRSRGYGSSFREVISVDEEWPEEDWASAGLEQLDAPFVARFEAKMKMRPILVPDKFTEPR